MVLVIVVVGFELRDEYHHQDPRTEGCNLNSHLDEARVGVQEIWKDRHGSKVYEPPRDEGKEEVAETAAQICRKETDSGASEGENRRTELEFDRLVC